MALPITNRSQASLRSWLQTVALLAMFAAPAHAQDDRRARREPGLVLETGGRTGACDVLTFTTDGKHLLAAGDDKVVHVWKVNGSNLEPEQVLRWSTWREQRGSIYALALSPDSKNQFVAIGGVGLRNDSVVVLDRFTGQPEKAITKPKSKPGSLNSVWAMTFSPSGHHVAYGTEDGNVWLWDIKSKEDNDVHRLGPDRASQPSATANEVRALAFLGERQLVSVTADGNVLSYDLANPQGEPRKLFQFERARHLFRVAIGPEHGGTRWIAAAGQSFHGGAPAVEVRALPNGQKKRTIDIPESSVPQSVAFDAHGERLAVGTKKVPHGATFAKDATGAVTLYDLKEEHPRGTPGPRPKLYADALAFRPDGAHLALADSNNYEVRYFKLSEPNQPVAVIKGKGHCIWEVALSTNGHQIGFLDERNSDPERPNHRGKGDLRRGDGRVFDFQKRVWAPAKGFQPVEPVETLGGWRVEPNPTDGYVWDVVGPNNQRHKLPLDSRQDAMPRCYTFLKTGTSNVVRLAVGHYWGVSVFELQPGKEPHRVRLFTGHQGEVMSVAPSADHKLLVTASRDQTISCWSLAAWPSQGELGARFVEREGKIFVNRVDLGSPAWEVGLIEGDEIVLFAFNAKPVYSRTPKYGQIGTNAECLERLQHPEPGKEFYFGWKRGNSPLQEQLTTVRQRPLWRFFPASDGEWVIWRWRDYYYDTSVHGDEYIGWQVSGDVNVKPEYYRAEQLRNRFYHPQKVVEVLFGALRDPERVLVPDIEPPHVSIQVSAKQVKDAGVSLTLEARPIDPTKNGQKLNHVVLLVNDFQSQAFAGRALTVDAQGVYRPARVEIPKEQLRRGVNTFTWICYNDSGGRGEAIETIEYTSDQPLQVHLYGLTVGINDYSKVKNVVAGNLDFCKQDAEGIRQAWLKQRGTDLYKDVAITPLLDAQATRENIFLEIKSFAKKVKPDDWVIFFFAGHGMAEEAGKDPETVKPGTFVFLCPNFDGKQKEKTGVTARDFHAAVAELNCRKLVLFDACHSGDLPVNPIRELHRGEKVAIFLAACEPYQESQESREFRHGYFTLAVLDALENRFGDADANKDGYLDSQELAQFVEKRVRELSRTSGEQHPRYSPQVMGRIPLAQKKK